MLCCLLGIAPLQSYAMSIRVDIDINIINGDGTLNCGDENESSEERNDSGSSREDNSDRSRDSHDSSD